MRSLETFRCTECRNTYQQHWRDRAARTLCRTCGAQGRGECVFDDHPNHPHPCSYGSEKPAEPCRFCARPVPLHGDPCPHCWQSLEGMTIADIKAVFALDGTFHIRPEDEE